MESIIALFLDQPHPRLDLVSEDPIGHSPVSEQDDDIPLYNDGYMNHMRTMQEPFFNEHFH